MVKTGIKLDLDVGDLISNAGRAKGAISAIAEAMDKAEKEKNWDDYGKLAYQKQRLESQNMGYEHNLKSLTLNPKYQTTTANGATVLKMDSEFGQWLKDLNDNIKKLYTQHDEQMGNEKLKEAGDTFSQIDRLQGERNKLMKEANAPDTKQKEQSILKAIGIGQIANAINEGFSRYASSLDRSGIISQYGSGDVMGGRIAEQKRQADLAGGMAQTVGGILGSVIGTFVEPGGGTILGGTLGSAAGKALDTAFHIPISGESNEAAYAGLWQQRSADAMNLNALMGNDAVIGNRNMVREAFQIAAEAAEKFGYSAEEGMDAMKKAAMQGLSKEDAERAASQVFDYERRTGADRGTLTSASLMVARYKTGNILQMGWAGLQASGMGKGQYNEYLRAMQRVMEDAISKGFIKSADEVAKSFTYLSQLTNNSPLWQGENGARRLMDMNAGLENATGLKSTSDIIAYRAARNLTGGGSYINAMMKLEEGLSPELFNEYMKLTKSAEGGSKEGIIERMRQTFGLKYKSAYELYEGWDPSMTSASVKALVDRYNTPPPKASSPELEWAQLTAQTANIHVQTGQLKFDELIPKLREERDKAKEELVYATQGGYKLPTDTSKMTPDEITGWALRGYGEFQSTLGSYFSPGDEWWKLGLFKSPDEKNDYNAMEKIKTTVGKAFYSEDAGQIEQAAEIVNILRSIPVDTRKEWDANNKLNSLAGYDTGELLTAIRQLHSDLTELNYTAKENNSLTITYE